jgi:hypothetical protein
MAMKTETRLRVVLLVLLSPILVRAADVSRAPKAVGTLSAPLTAQQALGLKVDAALAAFPWRGAERFNSQIEGLRVSCRVEAANEQRLILASLGQPPSEVLRAFTQAGFPAATAKRTAEVVARAQKYAAKDAGFALRMKVASLTAMSPVLRDPSAPYLKGKAIVDSVISGWHKAAPAATPLAATGAAPLPINPARLLAKMREIEKMKGRRAPPEAKSVETKGLAGRKGILDAINIQHLLIVNALVLYSNIGWIVFSSLGLVVLALVRAIRDRHLVTSRKAAWIDLALAIAWAVFLTVAVARAP